MPTDLRRDWDSREWEAFTLRLVQLRHGAENVQTVPDKVKGDAGIEFLTTHGFCYQCYAPSESSNTAKASSAMKNKATRDLKKLIEYEATIKRLLGERKITRWILLCPFLDDKSVIEHVISKAADDSIRSLEIISDDFHVLVQSLVDFESEYEILRSHNLAFPIDPNEPEPNETAKVLQSIGPKVIEKLTRGFPDVTVNATIERAQAQVYAHLLCADALDQLKSDYPELWETYRKTLSSEELRLSTVGSGSGDSAERLLQEHERMESKLSDALPSLPKPTISILSTGTLATWLLDCPLDFAESNSIT